MERTAAVLSDLSGAGRCSLSATLAVLPALQIHPFPLPTAVLSAQTGFPGFVLQDLTDSIDSFSTHWQALGLRFDGIYTGFLTSPAQVAAVLRFLNAFQRPDNLTLVDPILGDGGALYPGFSPALCARMAELVGRATLITPNLTEACLLSGVSYTELSALPDGEKPDALAELTGNLAALGPKQIVLTGVHMAGRMLNFCRDGAETASIETYAYGGSFSGTGDLFASVLCGALLRGAKLFRAARLAADFCAAAASAAAGGDPRQGVPYEFLLGQLTEVSL